MTGYRYGPYRDGPDPLAPPYDAALALDELGDAVLAGSDPAIDVSTVEAAARCAPANPIAGAYANAHIPTS